MIAHAEKRSAWAGYRWPCSAPTVELSGDVERDLLVDRDPAQGLVMMSAQPSLCRTLALGAPDWKFSASTTTSDPTRLAEIAFPRGRVVFRTESQSLS